MSKRPMVVTLCGSTRFPEAFALANMHLTVLGCVVLSVGMYAHVDQPAGAKHLTADAGDDHPIKQALDALHFRKIEMSDGIFVVNPGGYVGASTKREISYARSLGKTVQWMFPEVVDWSALYDDEEANRDEQLEGAIAAHVFGEGSDA